jgi:predicted nucleic acid-binding protein
VSTFVIDASIAVKWVVQESGSEEARSLQRHRLYAPDILVAECANILWKKVRLRQVTPRHARLAAELMERADIELMPMRGILTSAMELAIELDHPAYDCMYLALANTLACDFVTADARLLRKRMPSGFASHVLALSAIVRH